MAIFSHGGGANKEFYRYKILQSLQFDSGSTTWMETVHGAVPTDLNVCTTSVWLKFSRPSAGNLHTLFGACNTGHDGDYRDSISINATGQLTWQNWRAAANLYYGITDDYLRDPTNWFHLVYRYDSTQATGADRVRIYVNGNVWSQTTYVPPVQDYNTLYWNNTVYNQGIGYDIGNETYYSDCLYAEMYHVDGQSLAPSNFGTTKEGVWVPTKYTGTYGNNGFYLDFGNTSDFGEDSSGNSNDFTDTNFTADHALSDSPTDNYCTLNDISKGTITCTYGNRYTSGSATNDWETIKGTHILEGSNGDSYYWEVLCSASNGSNSMVGICDNKTNVANYMGASSSYIGIGWQNSGNVHMLSSNLGVLTDTWTTNDVLGLHYNTSTGVLTGYINNVSQGTLATIADLTVDLMPGFSFYTTSNSFNVNFGQTDFTYTPPAGSKRLRSRDMPYDTDTYQEGNQFVDVVLYEGTGAELAISSLDFSPDVVLLKNRDQADSWQLYDTERGATERVRIDQGSVEDTQAQGLKSFDSNGFTLGTLAGCNTSSENYVAFCWKKGAAYGFDMQTYTGTQANLSVPHDLGVIPNMAFVIDRDTSKSIFVTCFELPTPSTDYLNLSDVSVFTTSATAWNSTYADASNFYLGASTGSNLLNDEYILYLFADVPGYFKVFRYQGNASADGTYVNCGFRPRFVLLKNMDNASVWQIVDSERDPYNPLDLRLEPCESDAEASSERMDFTASGFKIRNSGAGINGSGERIIGFAFAESPFKYNNAR